MVSVADLQRLYADLAPKAREAVERHLESVPRQPEDDPDEYRRLADQARSVAIVTVAIDGADGEQLVYSSPEVLDESTLPHRITRITFDSAAAIQRYNVTPNNRFTLRLDFSDPPGFDVYNPWDQPTPNDSNLSVVGTDHTWATAVFESTLAFFQRRKRRRAWLHSHATFNLLSWLVGFPGALWIVYRLDAHAPQHLLSAHTVVRGAVYVYVFLFALLIFRLCVYGFRWLFPVVELEGARSKTVRGLLGTALASLLLALVYDVLKALLS